MPFMTPTHTVVTATTTSGAALAANAQRIGALFINDSDAVMWIKIGATAAANAGIRLNASGGSYEMTDHGDNLSSAAVNVVSATTGKKLLVTEWA